MLQTQHTIASQNWQRIEGSLQHRNDSLEKEKNDLSRRWEEEKKKLKDSVQSNVLSNFNIQIDSKRARQSQIEDLKRQIKSLESDLLQSQSQAQSLQSEIQLLETQISDQSTSFAKEKDSLLAQFESTLETRLKQEKSKWEEESQSHLTYPPSLSASNPFSPSQQPGPFSAHFISTPTTPFSPYFMSSPVTSRPSPRMAQKSVSPQPEPGKPRGGVGSRTTSYGDLRRPSRLFEAGTPANLTINTLEDEEEREFLRDVESPRNTVVDAVSVSASTSTAGPSVNIMERMSAAVRRLESDLVAKKEELSRTLKQRDEAREECVNLMSEVEEKRKFQSQVGDWQRKYEELDNR